MNNDERREYLRQKQAERRARLRQQDVSTAEPVNNPVSTTAKDVNNLPHYVTGKLTPGEVGNLTRAQRMERYDYHMRDTDHRSINASRGVPPRSPILDQLVAQGVPLASDYASHYPASGRVDS